MLNLDIPALLDLLDKTRKSNPENITQAYQNMFSTPDGRMALVDLMDRFFEFQKTSNDQESGAQSVLIYIKNTAMLGKIDTSWYEPPPQEQEQRHVE